MDKYFVDNIEKIASHNKYFREVLFTSNQMQLVVMSLKPLEEIGMEIHPNVDQFFRFEQGNGIAILNGNIHILRAGTALVVPAGVKHNIINTSKKNPLKLYTIYAPPQHPPGTINKDKVTD